MKKKLCYYMSYLGDISYLSRFNYFVIYAWLLIKCLLKKIVPIHKFFWNIMCSEYQSNMGFYYIYALSSGCRLCLTGGEEVHDAIVNRILDLSKAFSVYDDEVLVNLIFSYWSILFYQKICLCPKTFLCQAKRKELLELAQDAITGLKVNADILRLTFVGIKTLFIQLFKVVTISANCIIWLLYFTICPQNRFWSLWNTTKLEKNWATGTSNWEWWTFFGCNKRCYIGGKNAII